MSNAQAPGAGFQCSENTFCFCNGEKPPTSVDKPVSIQSHSRTFVIGKTIYAIRSESVRLFLDLNVFFCKVAKSKKKDCLDVGSKRGRRNCEAIRYPPRRIWIPDCKAIRTCEGAYALFTETEGYQAGYRGIALMLLPSRPSRLSVV